jgi:tmRNA-binding protein
MGISLFFKKDEKKFVSIFLRRGWKKTDKRKKEKKKKENGQNEIPEQIINKSTSHLLLIMNKD